MRNSRIIICLTLLLALLLVISACVNTPSQIMTILTESAEALINSVDQTQAVMLAEGSGSEEIQRQPGEGSYGATSTPIVLQVQKRGATQTIVPIATSASSDSGAATSSSAAVSADNMMVSSYSPASGSTVLPNEAFHLDITLYNSGSTTWQTTYKVIDYSNTSMAVEKTHNLPNAVAPGGSTVLSIYLAAPSTAGSYNQNYQIQDAYGVTFGYFDYVVTVGDYSSITSIPTLTATITPTYYSAEGITATPYSHNWMCVDRERSNAIDCIEWCQANAAQYPECYHHGERYYTPTPEPVAETTE